MPVYGGFVYGGDTYSGLPSLDCFEYELGTFQGRIQPTNGTPDHGDYVFVLGSDRLPDQQHDIGFGDNATLEQQVDLTEVNYVRAVWQIRQPSVMPLTTAIVGPSVLFGGVLDAGDNLLAIKSTSDVFVHTDVHRIVRIANATNPGNDGDKRITGIVDARTAILDSGIVVSEDPLGAGSGTASLIGARWKVSLTIGATERVSRVEDIGDDIVRVDLAAHVSKLSGNQTVKFKFELIEEP